MENFFSLYHEYTKRAEPPQNYHAWSAIATISALLGKKCFIPQGHFTVYPNLYIILVGEPAMRKSTALNVAKKLVRLSDKVPLAPESSTREAMIDDMAKNKVVWELLGQDISYWQSAAFVGELEQFFGGKHINQQMVGFLTAIWDEPSFKERTRKGGEIIINNPYFSLLGCCTPDWMNSKLKQDVISDGFSRRTIFVLEDQLNCLNSWPSSSEEETKTIKILETEVTRIFNIAGIFTFTKEAREIWDKEYIKIHELVKTVNPKIKNYYSSKHILAQKISMCLSAGIRSDRVVDSTILKMAYKFLEYSEQNLERVFSGVGRNELKSLANKTLARIEAAGKTGIKYRDLLTVSYDDMNLTEFKEVIDSLSAQGSVFAKTLTASEMPTYYSAHEVKQSSVLSLLELAGRTTVSSERPIEPSLASVKAHLVDPVTEKLLARQQKVADAQRNGILRPGKLRELYDLK